jgi:hypothetical protein
VYTIRLGRTILYLSNLESAKKIRKKKIGEREYELSQVRNRNGEFILIRQLEDNNTGGGLLVLKENFDEFVKLLTPNKK